jgi:phage terminase large subunit
VVHDQAERIQQEVNRRLELALRTQGDATAQVEVCKDDPVRFVNDWVWTYDPRNAGVGLPPNIPFVLRPKQAEFIRWLQEREREQESGLVEKSRDEGMTFVMCAYMLHHWLFIPGFAGAIGSRKEDLVDKSGDPKSIFWKIRFQLERLPKWFYPEGFNRNEHDNYMRLVNPAIGSSITGEAGDNMGRGGRATLYFIDEWAFIDRAESVNAAVSQNSNVRIKGSTPNGVGNVFYEERFSGKLPIFTFHWRDNPAKNYFDEERGVYPWYERQKKNLDPVTVAQEIDIDYTASVQGIVIPAKYVQAALDFEIEDGALITAGLDVSDNGDDLTPWGLRKGGNLRDLRVLEANTINEKAWAAIDLTNKAGAKTLYYDRVGVGAAMRGTLETSQPEFEVIGLNNGEKPTSIRYEDDPDIPADQRFDLRGSELWWNLMLRFLRTYERVTGIDPDHPDEDCISLKPLKDSNNPHLFTLVTQLSQPTYKRTSRDKLSVNKYGEGSKSPDFAETVMYTFAVEPRFNLPGPIGWE